MSLPGFPNVDPPIQQEGAVNQTLSSIAMEELGLSHLLNVEGEKLQYVLSTLAGFAVGVFLEEVIRVNRSVKDTLSGIVERQIMRSSKLSTAMKAPVLPGLAGPRGPMGPAGPAGDIPGPDGADGAVGPMSNPPTAAASFAAYTQDGRVGLNQYEMWKGTDIGLPDERVLSPDILTDYRSAAFLLAKGASVRSSTG